MGALTPGCVANPVPVLPPVAPPRFVSCPAARNPASILLPAVTVERTASAVGGGAMPLAELPSWALVLMVDGAGADAVDAMLRAARVPVVARVVDGRVVLDVRTITERDEAAVVSAVRGMVEGPR